MAATDSNTVDMSDGTETGKMECAPNIDCNTTFHVVHELSAADFSVTTPLPIKTSTPNGHHLHTRTETDDNLQAVAHNDEGRHQSNNGALNGKFLEAHDVIAALTADSTTLTVIPLRVKENVYYLVDNGTNVDRHTNRQRTIYL